MRNTKLNLYSCSSVDNPKQLVWHKRTYLETNTVLSHWSPISPPIIKAYNIRPDANTSAEPIRKFKLQWRLQTRVIMSLAWEDVEFEGILVSARQKSARDSDFNSHRNFYSMWRLRTASFDYVWHVTFELRARVHLCWSFYIPFISAPIATSVWRRVLMPKAAAVDFTSRSFWKGIREVLWTERALIADWVSFELIYAAGANILSALVRPLRRCASPSRPTRDAYSQLLTKVTSIVARRLHSSEWARGAFHKFAHSFHKRFSLPLASSTAASTLSALFC